MSDDEILDAASIGGLAQITSSFVAFGAAQNIGDGVDGLDGNFEIDVQQAIPDLASPCAGEEISILINKGDGLEFLIARFKGLIFEVDPDMGLEPLQSLHLADAKVVVGNRYGANFLSTSIAPEKGSFSTWIVGFSAITDPNQRLADADADGDGRCNFLEYATGGDPTAGIDPSPCQLVTDPEGDFWVRFSRATGIGRSALLVESSSDLVSPWLPLDGPPEPDPEPPSVSSGVEWLRIKVPSLRGRRDSSACTWKITRDGRLRTIIRGNISHPGFGLAWGKSLLLTPPWQRFLSDFHLMTCFWCRL
jgi:hypothetical protein